LAQPSLLFAYSASMRQRLPPTFASLYSSTFESRSTSRLDRESQLGAGSEQVVLLDAECRWMFSPLFG
jgi:hypothetical protein